VRDVTREHGVGLILSYHNFKATPPAAELAATFRKAETLGGDVAKVAVMPQKLHDVLTLLEATLDASESLAIPVLTMSMGGYGSLSRMIGWTFGSVITFAVGQSSSAPGQIPIDDLRTALAISQRAVRGG
jgi:3-dehydroquinate dehydratase-1